MQKPFLPRGNGWTEKANFATFAKNNINVAFLGSAMDKVAFPYRSSSHLILDAQAGIIDSLYGDQRPSQFE